MEVRTSFRSKKWCFDFVPVKEKYKGLVLAPLYFFFFGRNNWTLFNWFQWTGKTMLWSMTTGHATWRHSYCTGYIFQISSYRSSVPFQMFVFWVSVPCIFIDLDSFRSFFWSKFREFCKIFGQKFKKSVVKDL